MAGTGDGATAAVPPQEKQRDGRSLHPALPHWGGWVTAGRDQSSTRRLKGAL